MQLLVEIKSIDTYNNYTLLTQSDLFDLYLIMNFKTLSDYKKDGTSYDIQNLKMTKARRPLLMQEDKAADSASSILMSRES